jgi:hypothetical protein
MDKDRIKGSAQQAKGKVKEVAGKVTGEFTIFGIPQLDPALGTIAAFGTYGVGFLARPLGAAICRHECPRSQAPLRTRKSSTLLHPPAMSLGSALVLYHENLQGGVRQIAP